MVTQRMMVQGPRPSAPNAHQYKSGIEAIRRIARSEGILGAPALLRTVAAVVAPLLQRFALALPIGCADPTAAAHSCDGCVLCALSLLGASGPSARQAGLCRMLRGAAFAKQSAPLADTHAGLYRGFSANMWCSMPMAGVQVSQLWSTNALQRADVCMRVFVRVRMRSRLCVCACMCVSVCL